MACETTGVTEALLLDITIIDVRQCTATYVLSSVEKVGVVYGDTIRHVYSTLQVPLNSLNKD